jgi:hypothetical protein
MLSKNINLSPIALSFFLSFSHPLHLPISFSLSISPPSPSLDLSVKDVEQWIAGVSLLL